MYFQPCMLCDLSSPCSGHTVAVGASVRFTNPEEARIKPEADAWKKCARELAEWMRGGDRLGECSPTSGCKRSQLLAAFDALNASEAKGGK
jgi:hypothetical protein